MKGFIQSLGNAVLTILVILLIGYGWAFFEIKIMLKPYPELFGYVFYQQADNKMEPVFEVDDILIFKKGEKYQKGDVIMYIDYSEEKNNYKVETVETKNDEFTITKCEKCETNSDPVENGAVIGKVVGKIAYFGRFINFFKQKWFLVTLGLIGCALIILSQYMKNDQKEKEQKSK